MNRGDNYFPVDGGLFPQHARLFLDMFIVERGCGGALNHFLDVNQRYGFECGQAAAADGDQIRQDFVIAAGIYSLMTLGIHFTNRGKLDYYIDDVFIGGQQDWYQSSVVRNIHKTITNVAIPSSGRHVLRLQINGKNASSSAYFFGLTAISISINPGQMVQSVF